MSAVAAPKPGTKIELGNIPMTGTCNDLVTINEFTVTLVGTQLQVYAQVTPNNATDSIVVLTVNANDGKGKTYAGASFAAGGEGGLPGEMVSVLAFSDLYDSSMTGNTVVASLQAYLLTGSGGCWVYQSQPVHL
jgi:hypothetical protein